MIEESMIREKFIKGYDCSQVVLSYFAERLGITEEMANKVSACFGGGMMHGDTCGAFTGAIMAVGLKYGHWDVNTLLRQKEEMMNKYAEFRALFLEKFATNSCKELLGYDVSLPEQLEEALSSELCGLHRTYISDIERCNRNISIDNIEKIEILEEIL